ncbi:MAG: 30S ribosomal protein S8 [Candidatus Marinimicrobia bacterium]|nr:30S ribosomal protein S8 [Candidatus Neomarinimicrobiota bacterium]
MAVTDPIADYLTRIRNGYMAEKRWIDVPASNTKKRISLVLKHEGYIKDFVIIKDNKQDLIRIYLKYYKEDVPVIKGLKRVSKPGRRIYSRAQDIPRTLNGLGVTLVSTSEGVLADKVAKKMNVGGEVLCKVW